MSADRDIWLGDWLRGMAALNPANDYTQGRLVDLLGMGWLPLPTARQEAEPPVPAALDRPAAPPDGGQQALDEAGPPPCEIPAPPPAQPQETLTYLRTLPPAPDTALSAVVALEPYEARHSAPALPHPPLLRPEWSRSLMGALAETPAATGGVDAAALAALIAQGRAVRRIPRRHRWSLVLGAQLIIDIGSGMEPFALDQMAFIRQFSDHVGRDSVRSVRSSGPPLPGQGGRNRPSLLPEPGVPVVALSDLGLAAGGGRLRDWAEFAGLLAARRCRLAILIPYPRCRWPQTLPANMALLEWDRPTTAGLVRRTLEKLEV